MTYNLYTLPSLLVFPILRLRASLSDPPIEASLRYLSLSTDIDNQLLTYRRLVSSIYSNLNEGQVLGSWLLKLCFLL